MYLPTADKTRLVGWCCVGTWRNCNGVRVRCQCIFHPGGVNRSAPTGDRLNKVGNRPLTIGHLYGSMRALGIGIASPNHGGDAARHGYFFCIESSVSNTCSPPQLLHSGIGAANRSCISLLSCGFSHAAAVDTCPIPLCNKEQADAIKQSSLQSTIHSRRRARSG